MSIAAGLIGYGLAGSAFHAPFLATAEGLRLAAVATSRADAVAADYPEARVLAPDALLADPSIALVVIATPNETHAPLARAALEAGKHVVIDKPFVTDPAEGEALIALAAERGRVLSVFHNRRWDDDFLTLTEALAGKRFGELALFESRWDRFRPAIKPGWRERPAPGAGLLADLGPHLIDQALVLFGMPDALTADIAVQRGAAQVDDYFELTLHYGMMRAILSAATLMAAARPRFAVHGSEASWISHGLDPQEASLRAGMRPDAAGFGVREPDAEAVRIDAAGTRMRQSYSRGNYAAFYNGMAAAIRDGTQPPVDPADALAAIRLIALARRSAAEGRRFSLAST